MAFETSCVCCSFDPHRDRLDRDILPGIYFGIQSLKIYSR